MATGIQQKAAGTPARMSDATEGALTLREHPTAAGEASLVLQRPTFSAHQRPSGP